MQQLITEEEIAELDATALKYEAGTATMEEMRRAYILQGYDEVWADRLAHHGYPTE